MHTALVADTHLSAAPCSWSEKPAVWRLLGRHLAEQDARPAFRLVWRLLRSPQRSLRWLAALEDIRIRAGAQRVPYAMLRKNCQPYLHHGLSHRQKIHLFTTHYGLIFAAFGRQFVRQLLHEEPVILARLEGKAGAVYEVQLGINILNRNEGELILELVRTADSRRVLSLSLVAGALHVAELPDLWIGGSQGASNGDGKEVTVRATRDLWGLRPKDLLIHVSYALRDLIGVADIKGITNEAHIRHARPLKKIWHADYSQFWEELGGVPIEGGFYQLPKTRTRRSIEEVPPAKRSAWRARYSLVDAVTTEVALRLAHIQDDNAVKLTPQMLTTPEINPDHSAARTSISS
ncbi:MAG: DUF535 family protein [Acidocella sp.]|nr:DUF535 family protein [Acidocella sp.]